MRHDNPDRDLGPWVPGHSGVRSGLRARGQPDSGRRSSRSLSSSWLQPQKHQMRRALTCGGVRSPPSAPQGWGERPRLRSRLRGGEWARQQHASAASSSSSASTSSSCSGGDTRRAPRKWPGPDNNSRPKASRTLRPAGTVGGAGRGGGDPAAAHASLFRPFPSALTQGRGRARMSRSEKAEGDWCQGQRRREQSYRARTCSLPPSGWLRAGSDGWNEN
ncbi:uncharacterized protein [Muntiacus reevesi]|uniref:uncharacterized protein n=1 Tax=Muntiacus reevesi TaxID=9886 RepID=UPI0033071A4F